MKNTNEETTKTWFDVAKDNDDYLIELYQSGHGHISHSSMNAFKQSPFDFLKYKTFPKEDTKATNEGTIFHMMLLEPNKLKEKYFVFDDTAVCDSIGGAKPRGTNKYKEWKEVELAKHEGKEAIDRQMLLNAKAIFARLRNNPEFLDLWKRLKGFIPEDKVTGSLYGYDTVSVLDINHSDIIVDIKYVSDNSLRGTDRAYWGEIYGTYRQQGFYSSLYDFKKEHYVLFISHSGDCRIRRVDDYALRFGFDAFSEIVRRFDECVNNLGTFMAGSEFWSTSDDNKLIVPSYLIEDSDD